MDNDLFSEPTEVTEHQKQSMTLVRDECRKLASIVTDLVPEGKYRAVCITRLEEISLWANKGISRGD